MNNQEEQPPTPIADFLLEKAPLALAKFVAGVVASYIRFPNRKHNEDPVCDSRFDALPFDWQVLAAYGLDAERHGWWKEVEAERKEAREMNHPPIATAEHPLVCFRDDSTVSVWFTEASNHEEQIRALIAECGEITFDFKKYPSFVGSRIDFTPYANAGDIMETLKQMGYVDLNNLFSE